jgi:hypothetical protein
MVDLGKGVFAMAAGSNDGTTIITTNDYNAIGLSLYGTGYIDADQNMNGNVFVDDYNFVGSNLFMSSKVP